MVRKNELVSNFHVNVDLNHYSQEVMDYVIDQLPDRLMQLRNHELEVTNEGDGTITVSIPILDLIEKIKDEKLADIDYEFRHGEREE